MNDSTEDNGSKLSPEQNSLLQELTASLEPEYRLKEILGSGGFGSVFRAIHANTGQDVAIKVLRPQQSWSSSMAKAQVARFEREAELCAGIHHPNIVRLLSRGRTQTALCYAIYELVPGETLRSMLAREGSLSVDCAGELMGQVLDALATAHSKGVVHRDLKPENIMVINTGLSSHTKVLDFGIGTLTFEARDTAFNDLTKSNEMLGTAFYSSPEQLRGDPPTIKTDLYAWGLVFLECITGQRTITGTTLAEIYHQHLSPLEIPLPPSIASHSLGAFLRKVLLKEQNKRSGDAAALYQEFQQLHLGNLVGSLKGRPQSANSTPRPQLPNGMRQVLAIALSLNLQPTSDSTLNINRLDALLDDQLNLCRDALSRYGGTVTEQLGAQLVALFGYPSASDTDARLAVRTVIELRQDIVTQNEQLEASHDCELQFRVGMHTGPVTVRANRTPTGMTIVTALALATGADANTIVTSAASARIIAPFADLYPSAPIVTNGEASPQRAPQLVTARHSETSDFLSDSTSTATFVGRESELARLHQIAETHKNGIQQAVLVSGEAGIGKSRLMWEFVDQLSSSGSTIYQCRCLAEQKNTALSPILPLIRRLLGLPASEGMQASQALTEAIGHYGICAEQLVPILCRWLSLPCPTEHEPASAAPHHQREVLLDAIVTILSQPNDAAPVIILVEDLHWADPTTLELLDRFITQKTPDTPLMLCTARSEFEAPWQEPVLINLHLPRLHPKHAEQLIFKLWKDDKPTPTQLVGIIERADGIPLFIEEVVHMLQRRTVPSHNSNSDPIPATLHALLTSRLDRLGDGREIAQLAAVLGRQFDERILHAAATVSVQVVDAALERLLANNLLQRSHQDERPFYIFRHALIQAAAYNSMPRDARRQTHERIARLLEKHAPLDDPHSESVAHRRGNNESGPVSVAEPETIARHWAAADKTYEAIRSWRQACKQAEMKAAHLEAVNHTDEALLLIPKLEAADQLRIELEVQIMRKRSLLWSKGFSADEFVRTDERIRTLSKSLDSNAAHFDTLRDTWVAATARGDMQNSDTTTRELRLIAGTAEHTIQRKARITAEATFAGTRCWLGDFQAGLDTALNIVQLEASHLLAENDRDNRLALLGAYSFVVFSATQLNMPKLAKHYWDEALAIIETPTANRFESVMVLSTIAHALAWLRKPDTLLPIAKELHDYQAAPVNIQTSADPYIFGGWATAVTNSPQHGIESTRHGIKMQRHKKIRQGELFSLSLLADAQIAAGHLNDARSTIEDALSSDNESRSQRAEILRIRGRCEEAAGNRTRAEIGYQEAINFARQFDARLIMCMAEDDLLRVTASDLHA